jgi:DUF971 family protein
MGRVIRPVVEHGAGAFELRRYELVGGYGVQLFWSDGHGSGIYSLDYLEKLDTLSGN